MPIQQDQLPPLDTGITFEQINNLEANDHRRIVHNSSDILLYDMDSEILTYYQTDGDKATSYAPVFSGNLVDISYDRLRDKYYALSWLYSGITTTTGYSLATSGYTESGTLRPQPSGSYVGYYGDHFGSQQYFDAVYPSNFRSGLWENTVAVQNTTWFKVVNFAGNGYVSITRPYLSPNYDYRESKVRSRFTISGNQVYNSSIEYDFVNSSDPQRDFTSVYLSSLHRTETPTTTLENTMYQVGAFLDQGGAGPFRYRLAVSGLHNLANGGNYCGTGIPCSESYIQNLSIN
jgi:hypothetical protein